MALQSKKPFIIDPRTHPDEPIPVNITLLAVHGLI
jgi:hypothetical protein